MNEKQIKQEIRKLKKIKLALIPGSKERIKLHRAIKELKKKLEYKDVKDEVKTAIIKEILKIKPHNTNLYKFTQEQLKFHLERLKKNN